MQLKLCVALLRNLPDDEGTEVEVENGLIAFVLRNLPDDAGTEASPGNSVQQFRIQSRNLPDDEGTEAPSTPRSPS